MACTPSPTATLYGVLTSFIPSTSYSQSGADSQPQVTTIVQQSCVASGTINGSSVECISSAQVNEVTTVGGGGQAAQVPIVVTVPVTESQPTQTLFAPCTSGDTSSPSPASTQSSTPTPVITSVLVQSTPEPSTVIKASSATLSDGSVVETVITLISTQPPTAVYVPTTSLASATLQNNGSQDSGTNVLPIVGGVLGGFLGLIAIVGCLWWLCRRRRSWDDIFEKDDLQNNDTWAVDAPVRRDRNNRSVSSAEPRPYQYGLVGHVIPPAAAGETLRSSHYGSVSEQSGTHSRNTSYSATPLLQGTRTGSSRPSTAASILTAHTQPGSRVRSSAGNTETQARSLSIVSSSNITEPPLDGQSTPALLSNWSPNTDDLESGGLLNHTGSPGPSAERRILQIVNDGPPSPTDTVAGARRASGGPSSPSIIMHVDGGRVPEGTLVGLDEEPPAYSS